MLNQTDEQWLRNEYPALVLTEQCVEGDLAFVASYDRDANRFRVLKELTPSESYPQTLSGRYRIRIQDRIDKSTSKLPALYVEAVEQTPDRHFNQQDKSACLCSPLEEREFLEPDFDFPKYIEQLVIPFLYGQLYFTSHQNWPWSEYAHGTAGILEAYAQTTDQTSVLECLRQLRRDPGWPKMQAALQQKPFIKGHTPCFCPTKDHIRRCHPAAWKGALRLQKDLEIQGISVSE